MSVFIKISALLGIFLLNIYPLSYVIYNRTNKNKFGTIAIFILILFSIIILPSYLLFKK